MKNIIHTIAIVLIISFVAKAGNNHDNSKASKSDSQKELLQMLNKSDIKFEASLENDVVRGIQSASYYFDGNSGLLYVKFHDKELVYKDVPLKVWMEWKFSDSITSYYKQNIKYDYIAV